MSWQLSLPRPTRTLLEWLTATRVAPVANRWRALAHWQAACPALAGESGARLYQLPYLAAQRRAAFVAGFSAGRLASIRLLGKLEYTGPAWWPEVRGELVSVHLVRRAAGDWVLLLGVGEGLVEPQWLPVPRRGLLLLRLLPRKLILC